MAMPGFAAEASLYRRLEPACSCGPKGEEGCICNKAEDCLENQSCSCTDCYDYSFGFFHLRGGTCKCV